MMLMSNAKLHMPWNLTSDSNIRMLPVHEQLFAFAYAYLAAATVLGQRAVERAELKDWPAGAVVLMNAAHAVELFLKATLLRKNSNFDVWAFSHDIHSLANEYERQFPEQNLSWDIPFRHSLPDDLNQDQKKYYREHTAQPSIQLRYPVSRLGSSWLTLQAFEPHSFQQELLRMEKDFDRIYHREV